MLVMIASEGGKINCYEHTLIRRAETCGTMTRVCLSDGCVFLSADTPEEIANKANKAALLVASLPHKIVISIEE